MLYESYTCLTFDGKRDYIDLGNCLHRLLHTAELSVDICFSTRHPGYQSLLAVYYKESLLPDFALELHKGRVTLITKRDGKSVILRGNRAFCDGVFHTLAFRGDASGTRVWVDGALELEDRHPGPYCDFGYVGFATVGRGVCQDQFANYFQGEISRLYIAEQMLPLPNTTAAHCVEKIPLFCKGMAGVENFRIPTLITTKSGVTIASADARVDAPGDNPNHICRAVRLSKDSGKSWSEPRVLFDFGGEGRQNGAAAIDGSLLYDQEKDTVFMLYSHTSAGVGIAQSKPGTGFDPKGRKRLWDREGREYHREPNGVVAAPDGTPTDYCLDMYGRLFREGQPAGSICHGQDRPLRQLDTSFLQLIRSEDGGETWSEPMDLNPQVKEEWMQFIGAGPGTGIQIQQGPYKGRLVYPIYFTSQDATVSSSAVIYSDDAGRSWKRGASVNDGRELEGKILSARCVQDPRASLGECQVAELPDGSLKIFLRNGLGKRTLVAESRDGGESWTQPQPQPELLDPQCQSHVLRISQNGNDLYLFSNPACESSRVQGTVRCSLDATCSWQMEKLLEPGEFGYSCMTRLPDGQIGILFEGSDITQYFAKFPVEWLLEP